MLKSIQFDAVADLYDTYVTSDFDLPFYRKETAQYNEAILELMCGTGRVSLPLLATGKRMVCVDYSHRMLIEFARKIRRKNYPVQLVQMDVTQLAFSRQFQCILLPFHSLSEIVSTALQVQALRAIAAHLALGGTAIIPLQNPTIRLKTADGTLRPLGEFALPNQHRLQVTGMNYYDETANLVSGTQWYQVRNAAGEVVEQRELAIQFKPISDGTFRAMIQHVGLEVVEMYGDYTYAPFEEARSEFMIYKLRKEAC